MGTKVSSTNKTDRHDINEISLKVALNTITLALTRPGYGPSTSSHLTDTGVSGC